MKRLLLAVVVVLAVPLTVVACLWDRDTPASEAKGMPEVIGVLAGRFERNPPLYYEMRLERVAQHLREYPEDLGAYDDAGVACDRLGRGDEAIAWMEKKLAQMEKLGAAHPEFKEQSYRYHANLGTFLVHRWAKQGADRARIDEVKAARDEIARAIEINPNAHFGREAYQLRAMEWIIDPPKAQETQYLPNLLGWGNDVYNQTIDPKDADNAVRGLAGLVVLGNAWESVDVFHALNVALQHDSVGYEQGAEGGRNTLAYLAWLRCRELIDGGKGSMLPDAPKGEALKALLPKPDFIEAASLLDPTYQKLRAEADSWHAARTAFLTARLKAGRHPDTDPTFWDVYVEAPAPQLPEQSVPEVFNARMRWRQQVSLAVLLAVVIGVPIALASGLWFIRWRNARRIADSLE